MDVILNDFRTDLARLSRLLGLLDQIKGFAAVQPSDPGDDQFCQKAAEFHQSAQVCHVDVLILAGAAVLYLGGRFEFFVKEMFEELCERIAVKCMCFAHLPKAMRESLIRTTAEVMASPRKFGHGEKGVHSFVSNLAANMAATSGLNSVNPQCLSITYENMRAETVRELYDRIGAKDIWSMVSDQAGVKSHFATTQSQDAKSKLTEYLNAFMDTRNRIAHPSSNVEWPDISKVKEYVAFFQVIARAICDVNGMYEATMPDPKVFIEVPVPIQAKEGPPVESSATDVKTTVEVKMAASSAQSEASVPETGIPGTHN
jgi:hypothetical protein